MVESTKVMRSLLERAASVVEEMSLGRDPGFLPVPALPAFAGASHWPNLPGNWIAMGFGRCGFLGYVAKRAGCAENGSKRKKVDGCHKACNLLVERKENK